MRSKSKLWIAQTHTTKCVLRKWAKTGHFLSICHIVVVAVVVYVLRYARDVKTLGEWMKTTEFIIQQYIGLLYSKWIAYILQLKSTDVYIQEFANCEYFSFIASVFIVALIYLSFIEILLASCICTPRTDWINQYANGTKWISFSSTTTCN